MRSFLIFLAVISALYLWQRHSGTTATKTEPVAANTHAASEAHPMATAQPQVSEHNWMKRSLDRATDVRNQARTQTRDSQNP